jgi:hypothetical protein
MLLLTKQQQLYLVQLLLHNLPMWQVRLRDRMLSTKIHIIHKLFMQYHQVMLLVGSEGSIADEWFDA